MEEKQGRSQLLPLFLTFFKIGAFTFGGGYAMIPLIQRETVESRKWITDEDVLEIIAIAESTPGPIAINCATSVGYRQRGLGGAIAATLGMVLPSFCIIYAISRFFDRFLEIAWVAHAFQGVKLAVGILILDAALKLIKKLPKKPLPRVILGCACAAMLAIDCFSLRLSSISLMLIAGALSLIVYAVRRGRAGAAQ